MSEKVSIADLISLGRHETQKWDWHWYIEFLKWFFTTNEKTNLKQKIDYLKHLLEQNSEFRQLFVIKWTAFIENVQFDSFWVHTFSGESDSFIQELIWAFNQKFLAAPAQGTEISYLIDQLLDMDIDFEKNDFSNFDQIQNLAPFFAEEKIQFLKTEIHKSLVRAIYILASKNLSDMYSTFFKMGSADKHQSDFVKTLKVVNLDEITDFETLKTYTENNLQTTNTIIEGFRETGVSLNFLYKIKKIKSRLIRIQNLVLLEQSFIISKVAPILFERRNFYSLKFQFFHYSAQLIEVVSMTSAETGDHYVGRSHEILRKLFLSACGGGFITAFTILIKTLLAYVPASLFFAGFLNGLLYAISFVAIYLLGFTLATKQPAAIAAHLTFQWQKLTKVQIFSEVNAIFKSQFWAVLGNVGIVIPTIIGISYLYEMAFHHNFMSPEKARAQIESMSVLSFSPFYAFLTGYFLWFSTFVSGAADNFFKVYKFDELILDSPKILSFISPQRKRKWVAFLKRNFGALSGNIVLGMILGIVPVIGTFLGLPIDVRHVTLSSGSIAAAIYTLGLDIFREPAIYLALVGVVVTGILNLSVSFMISLRVAESSNALSENALDHAQSKSILNLYILKKLGIRR
ncbi:hypothetical protein CIK05_03800 [Bdellovibrio sp. qaytius]|nr:hypothetical protein CIK05_03800 [Bdellovibrio sp. qaytius]